MKLVKKILYIFFIVFCTVLIFGSLYVKKIYPNVLFEELFFYLFNGANTADSNMIISGLKYCFPLILFLSIILYIILNNLYLSSFILKKLKKVKYLKIVRIVLSVFLLLVSIYILLRNLNFFEYIKNQYMISNFIEKKYINPKNVEISFPENKRNLIIIFVESLETSLFTKEQGGYWEYEVVPELYELLDDEDSVVFYDSNKTELMNQLDLSSYTTAGDVANTSGLPLKMPVRKNVYHSDNFMQGAYSLGDVLKKNGYYNEYISSSRTSFGGISDYFKKHGSYRIIDAKTCKNYGFSLSMKDMSSWGFNDNFLFRIAKERLETISKSNQPFNLILQTIDTHYIDGYTGYYSTSRYSEKYENAYATESRLIYEFINWIKSQDFYNNTTILIVGDHISMQADFFEARGAGKRYIYNCYINPLEKPKDTSNRVYTALDTYPTVLSSIGANIKGNKLGLGTNLFSNEKTLSEKYGFDYFNKELNKKSVFYNTKILGKDYDKLNEALAKDESLSKENDKVRQKKY